MIFTEPSGQMALKTCQEQCDCPGALIERDRWGRPIVEGEARTRASTLAATLDDSMGLVAWKARMAILGATPTTLRQAKAHRNDVKVLNELAEEAAQRAGAGDAATEGTLMHEVLTGYALDPDACDWEALDDDQAATVVAFGSALRAAGLRAVMAEQFVVGHAWAGTFDLGLVDAQGRNWLADIKTSAKMWDRRKPLKVATQLAAYASGQRWCPTNGWLPTPQWDGLLLISAPLDKGDVYLDEIDFPKAKSALGLALYVRATRAASKDWSTPMPEEATK